MADTPKSTRPPVSLGEPLSAAEQWEEGAVSVGAIRRRARRFDEPLVNLTPMVDVLSVLLFFLLAIYSGGGFLTTLPDGLKLPDSKTRTNLTRQIEVAVLKDKILVDREAVGDDPAVFLANQDLVLPALQAALASRAPQDGAEARITIEADRDVPFRLLKKVINTADLAGFRKQSLAVRQVGG